MLMIEKLSQNEMLNLSNYLNITFCLLNLIFTEQSLTFKSHNFLQMCLKVQILLFGKIIFKIIIN